MTTVFISHSSADRRFVEDQLVQLLRLHGLQPWYATQDVQSASVWNAAIWQGLTACEWFIVVLTPAAVGSSWVQAELQWALEHRNGRIVPVLAADCTVEPLSIRLNSLQWVDFRTDIAQARERLLAVWGRTTGDILALEMRYRVRSAATAGGEDVIIDQRTLMIRELATIGRAPQSDVHVDSPRVSRNHAVLKVREEQEALGLWLHDLGSRSGTMLNGRLLGSPTRLALGDTITLGDTLIEVTAINSTATVGTPDQNAS